MPWEETLTFVGTIIDLKGNVFAAVSYCMAQANKALAKWMPILSCLWIPKANRVLMLPKDGLDIFPVEFEYMDSDIESERQDCQLESSHRFARSENAPSSMAGETNGGATFTSMGNAK